MYNRYIPEGEPYAPVGMEDEPPREEERPQEHQRPDGPEYTRTDPRPHGSRGGPGDFLGLDALGLGQLRGLFTGDKSGGVGRLLNSLKLDDLDSGDILLLLIILFLLVEGDNLELVITLGLMLIMGLGDKEKKN